MNISLREKALKKLLTVAGDFLDRLFWGAGSKMGAKVWGLFWAKNGQKGHFWAFAHLLFGQKVLAFCQSGYSRCYQWLSLRG